DGIRDRTVTGVQTCALPICVGLVRRSRSLLLGNGTDVSRFSPDAVDPEWADGLRRELGIPKGAVVVGTVGRLVAEKGYHELFERSEERRVGKECRSRWGGGR